MNTIAAISVTTLPMLFGMGLVMLPVAAHLLNRRARRHVVFPSILLLRESSASQSQLFKMRHWLLLLLRCLTVTAVVLAFARPVWKGRVGATAREHGAAIVLLMDRSVSTRQQIDGVTVLKMLQGTGSRALDSLMRGTDKANVVHATARPKPAFPTMTGNLDLVKKEIHSVKATSERADLAEALTLAGEMLGRQEGTRHLVVLSDLQAANWSDAVLNRGGDPMFPEDTHVTFVPLDAPVPDNVALFDPGISPHIPLVGRPAQASVRVANHGDRPRTVRVALVMNEVVLSSRSVPLEPREEQQVQFELRFDAVGEHRMTFSMGRDALDADNRAHFVVHVRSRIPMVVIGDDRPDEPGSGTYFTIRALAPHGDAQDRFVVRHLTSGDVASYHFHDAAAVFVEEVGLLAPAAVRVLYDYVHRGGGLVLFCSGGPVAENLAHLDDYHEEGVLPWRPEVMRDLVSTGDMLFIADGRWQSPLLREFDERSRLTLSKIRFGRVWSASPVRDNVQVLLTYGDQTPALGCRRVGSGTVLLANFSAGLNAGDLGKHGGFVALIHCFVRGLESVASLDAVGTVGESLSITIPADFEDAPDDYRVVAPGGSVMHDATFASRGEALDVLLPYPHWPGFYVVNHADRAVGQMVINVDPRESDLRRVDLAQLQRSFEGLGVEVAIRDANTGRAILNLRGTPMWGWMLVIAMVLLGLESALLSFWRR